jgi:hypothetical protein
MAFDTRDEQRKVDELERWDQSVFRPNKISTPSYFDHESFDGQRKRLMNKAKPLVSEDLQKVRTDDIFGSALDHVAHQYFESAAAEARRPTKVLEGELREVTRYDQGGRPYYEYYGSPSAWMSNFAMPKRFITSIRDNRQWQKPSF